MSKLVCILVSLLPKVIATVDSVITSALGSIVLTYYLYRNLSSNCITEQSRDTIVRPINRPGI